MFIKCTLSKFEWKGQPKELPSLFIESLLLHSNTYNFVVTNFKTKTNDEEANGEFWSYFIVLDYEPKYKRPRTIQVINAKGEAYTTKDFVLFNEFKQNTTLNSNYINYYSQLIVQINKAIQQHITASQLIATVYAASKKEREDLEKIFTNFDGVKIVQHDTQLLDGGKKADIVQFEIEPRLKELEELKHEIERDLFLRLGIDNGTDKTHITNLNLTDSEQAIDLINCYELKLRENFCMRYNEWKGSEVLSVKIHNISADNSIQKNEKQTDTATYAAAATKTPESVGRGE